MTQLCTMAFCNIIVLVSLTQLSFIQAQISTQVVCDDTWSINGTSCYQIKGLDQEREPWNSALEMCGSLGATLANVDSSESNAFIRDLINGTSTLHSVWIGASVSNDDLSLTWTESDSDFTNWVSNFPKTRSYDSCVLVNNHGKWRNKACTARKPFMCQKSLQCSDENCVGCTRADYCGKCEDGFQDRQNDGTCLACNELMYGADCLTACHCQVQCDSVTGECPGQCDPGWQGTDCQQECDELMYGAGCETACNCQVQCDHITGLCLGDCDPGWKGTDCQQACDNHMYGAGCETPCHCQDQCDHITGLCPGECDAGWTGTDCQQECSAGQWGQTCEGVCGHCSGGAACDHVTGLCAHVCASGWIGEFCTLDLNDACDDEWLENVDTASCYHLNTTAVDFTSARAGCPTGSILTPITSQAENDFINDFIEETVWIGALVFANHTVVLVDSGEVATYTNFGLRFPTDVNADNDCVSVNLNGRWKNMRCAKNLPFTCRKPWNFGDV